MEDHPDLRAVARAYRQVRETGALDRPAYCAALWTYCARNPGTGADPNTSKIVGQLIHRASVKGLLWPVSHEVREV